MKVIRTILFVINIILAIGLLLTTLAPVVAPSESILPSLLAFGYLPMLAVNVLMVVVWLIMGKWHFLLSAAAIAARWSFVGLFMQVGGTSTIPDREDHPQMVTLMSYNLHNLKGPEIQPDISDNYALQFLDLVREYQPDIMCLQEYQSPGKMCLTDSLVLLGYNHYNGAHGSSTSPSGTTVFSRIPITYVKKIDQQKLLVELMLNDKLFRVCCIHMDSYAFDGADLEEIEKLRHGKMENLNDSTLRKHRTLDKVKETILKHESEWQEKIKPVITESTVPILLAGDFNDIPSSWLYAQVSKHLDDTYRDKGFGMCHTYSGGSEHWLPLGHNWLPQFRIDMVFHSKEFRTLSYKRLKAPLSDHYPVITSLELTQ